MHFWGWFRKTHCRGIHTTISVPILSSRKPDRVLTQFPNCCFGYRFARGWNCENRKLKMDRHPRAETQRVLHIAFQPWITEFLPLLARHTPTTQFGSFSALLKHAGKKFFLCLISDLILNNTCSFPNSYCFSKISITRHETYIWSQCIFFVFVCIYKHMYMYVYVAQIIKTQITWRLEK